MGDEELDLLTRALLGFFAPDRGPAFVITSESMTIIVERLTAQLRETHPDQRRALLVHWARHASSMRLQVLEQAARANPPARIRGDLALLLSEDQGRFLTEQVTPNFPDI